MVMFATLWNNYPDEEFPCMHDGNPTYPHQCSIRMGTCFARSGVQLPRVPHCRVHPRSSGHLLGVPAVIQGLRRHRPCGFGREERLDPGRFEEQIADRSGVIAFENYWVREGERRRSGDHIDLWNGTRLTSWTSVFRIHLGINIDGLWSDFHRSERISFWPVA